MRTPPAFIAVTVKSGGDDGKSSQRGLKYDTLSDRLARFLHDEVLPTVLNQAEIQATYPRMPSPTTHGSAGWGHQTCGETFHCMT